MEISLAELKSLVSEKNELPFEIGTAYLFRTITYHALGRVKSIVGKFLILEEAGWVADTGRYSDACEGRMMELTSSEFEPVMRPYIINSDHITDSVTYPYELPRAVK